MRSSGPYRVAMAILSAGMVAAAPTARAQTTGNGFLFGVPDGSFTFRGGIDQSVATGDLFQFVTNDFTLSKRDFLAISFAGDMNVRMGPRADLVLGVAWAGSRSASEYRLLVDNNNLPIAQTATLQRVPLNAGLRLYLFPPGQSVGRLAWVPSHVAPYVEAGGGAMWYRFRLSGDFVDTTTMAVFSDELTASNWTLTAYAAAGAEVALGASLFATGQVRYTWAHGSPGSDFYGYNRLDLSGVALSFGVGFRM